MSQRVDYYAHNSHAIQFLASIKKHLSSIDPKLTALIELRVSQLNGCVYCVDEHAEDARKAGESQQRLDNVVAWHESPFFTDREKAAFAWADSLTNVGETHAPDEDYDRLKEYFSEKEIVDLTLIISLMNAWNRIGVGFRKLPELRS